MKRSRFGRYIESNSTVIFHRFSNRFYFLIAAGIVLLTLLMNVVAVTIYTDASDLGVQFLFAVGVLGAAAFGSLLCLSKVLSGRMILLPLCLLAFLLAIYTPLIVLQEQSLRNFGQLMDFRFAWANLPIVGTVVPIPVILGVLALTMSATGVLAWALHRVIDNLRTKTLVAICSGLFVTVLAVSLVWRSGYATLNQEPMLAFMGASQPLILSDHTLDMEKAEIEAIAKYKKTAQSAVIADRPNIIVFMADSLAPKRFSLFGNTNETDPFLLKLRDREKYFSAARGRSSCSESVCAVTTMLLSRRYIDQPVRSYLGLGEALRMYGYENHFILVGDHRRYNQKRYLPLLESEADEIFDYTTASRGLNWDGLALEGANKLPDSGDTPRFIFVFLFSPHILASFEERFETFKPNYGKYAVKLGQQGQVPAEEHALIRNSYDNKLLQLDFYMNGIMERLSQKGYLKNYHLFFLGDHGEYLGERGRVAHGPIYEPGLVIPFVYASSRRDLPLDGLTPTQIDLGPTVLDLIDAPIPDVWRGQSLLRKTPGSVSFHESGLRKRRDGRYCFAAHGPMAGFAAGKLRRCRLKKNRFRNEFYDLTEDPAEERNIFPRLPEQKRRELVKLIEAEFGRE